MSKPQYTYYDCSLVSSGYDQIATYVDDKSESILEDSENYTMSVVQATIENTKLPVFSPSIDFTQPDPTKTTYILQISANVNYEGQSTTLNSITTLTWLNSFYPTPLNSSINNWNDVCNNRYYYCYDLNQFVKMFNDAISLNFSNLNALLTQWINDYGLTATQFDFTPPYIQINNSIFTLYFDKSVFNRKNTSGSQSENLKVLATLSFNQDLHTLLRNFPHKYNANLQCPYVLDLDNCYSDITNVDNVDLWSIEQIYPSIDVGWSIFKKLVFQTSMSVKGENVGQTLVLPITTGFNTTQTSPAKTITDIDLDISNANDLNTRVIYTPSFSREINTTGKNFKYINIYLLWKDKFGNYHPVYLDKLSSATIKLRFQKN